MAKGKIKINGGLPAKGNFIKGAIKRPGALHAALGVPKVGQEARFAKMLKGIKK